MTATTREPLRTRTYAALAACIVVASLVVRADALQVGFTVDDYAQLAMMRGQYPVPRGPLALFTFSDGSPAENQALRDSGFFPWWSHPGLKISMFRPLASALMWLDLGLFGLNAAGYQLHSLLWWLAMLGLFAALLRKLLPAGPALLALALFAFDEAHGMLLGWIAMRNAIVASCFALLALLLRMRAIERGELTRRAPALAAFGVALLAGEYAIAFAGYVVLLELLHAERGRARVAALAPWVAVFAVYFALRAAFGFGSFGSGMYVDPIAESGEFLRQAQARLPALAGDVMFGVRSNFWTAGFPWAAPLAAAGVVPPVWAHDMQPLRYVQQGLGVLALAVFALVVAVAADGAAGRRVRFLLFGAPLAMLPVLPALPEGRLLVPALVGSSVALACFAHAGLAGLAGLAGRGAGGARVRSALVLACGAALIAAQFMGALYFGLIEAKLGASLAEMVRMSILAPALDAPLRSAEHVLLAGAADPTTTIYVPLMRRVHGRPAPRAVHLLAGTSAPHRLLRVSLRAFVLDRVHPDLTPGDVYASAFNSRAARVPQRARAGGLRVTVERVHHGRPVRTRYELDVSLDDPKVLLLAQTAAGLVPIRFPAVGYEGLLLPPIPPFQLLGPR